MTYRNAILPILLVCTSSPALAAGYGLHEFSAEAMGSAYAGSAAESGDASFLPYNPASSSGVAGLDGSITAVGILPSSSASYPTALTSAGTPAGGNATPKGFVGGAVVPSVGARIRLSDQLTAGLAVFAPWDLATNYQPNFSGRYYAETTKLLTADIVPSLAYEIVPGITLAAGVQAEYAKGTLSNAVDVGTIGLLNGVPGSVPGAMDATATFTGADWNVGYNLGAMARVSDDLVLGASYTSRIDHEFHGMLRFQPDAFGLTNALSAATGLFRNTGGSAKLTVPDVVRTSARLNVTPEWEASLEADWTGWNSFKTLTVGTNNPAQPPDVTGASWKPTWMVALGARYHDEGPWSYRAGVAFDPSPIPDATLGPRIPDGDRIQLSLGTSYAVDSDNKITFAASHLFVDGRNVALLPGQTGNALRGALLGTTNADANLLGLQFSHSMTGLGD